MFGREGLLICTLMFKYLKIIESHPGTVKELLTEGTDDLNIQWNSPLDLKKLKSKSIAGFDYSNEEMKKLKLWKDGIIPYYIDTFSYDKVLRDKIRSFLGKVSDQTGVDFSELDVPPKDLKNRWVLFINRVGQLKCNDYTSSNLTNEGVQKVVLGYDCVGDKEAALAPTVLALAGVPPQHNAPDRDQHVNVYINNIVPDKQRLFQPLSNQEWLFHDLPYDFTSAGHFPFFKHSINGSKTIYPKKHVGKIKVGKGLSILDKVKLKMLYSYISKKKLNRDMTATCSKMFRPSPNIDKIPLPKNKLSNSRPRKKPDKYTGIKTDETEKHLEPREEKQKLSYIAEIPSIHKPVTPANKAPKSGTIVGTLTSNKLSNLSDYISSDSSY